MSLRPPPQHPTKTPSSTRLATPSISQPSTPPLPPRPGQSPGSDSPNLTVPFSSEPPISSTAPPPAVDDDISEAELREQYEDEEIQRFLTFFSAHVTEVRVPGSGKSHKKVDVIDKPSLFDDEYQSEDEADSRSSELPLKQPGTLPQADRSSGDVLSVQDGGWASQIAINYIIPILPPAPHPAPPFSIGRLRLTAQRLYVIAEGGYLPLILCLKRLSTWEDFNRSAIYCSVFWLLWTCDLLLPAFFLYLLYDLLCRKLRRYPSLQELREHRRKILHAEQFGEAIQTRILAAPSFDLTDAWRFWRMLPRPKASSKKDKGKTKSHKGEDQDKSHEREVQDKLQEEEHDQTGHECDTSPGDSTPSLLIETAEGEITGPTDVDLEPPMDEQDMRKAALQGLSELADFHERCFNLYMWKRPRSSMGCAAVLLALVLVTSFVPARYLAKMVYFTLGFLYWHVVPILVALPASERARIPPPLDSAPTNAEVAMELISQRVAQGLPVLPPTFNRRKQAPSPYMQDSPAGSTATLSTRGEDKPGVDWTKWGERAATGKGWASDAKGFVTRKPRERVSVASSVETHSFPAHHKTGPGLITTTETTLFFTPLVSSRPSLTVPLGEITGMKKKGVLKGLSVSWNAREGGKMEEKTEVFRWIGGRDEVFARLLSSKGRRWVNI